MAFTTALSGMKAANADLNVTSNNIANVATTGFKQSRAEFAELITNAGTNSIGSGVRVSTISQQFTQGDITPTGNYLDLAISKNGFFTVQGTDGTNYYTRAGNFQRDSNGYVTTPDGYKLQVFPPLADGSGFNTGSLTDLQLLTTDAAPKATYTLNLGVSLPANSTAPTVATFDPTDTNSYNQTTATTAYDSLGVAHEVRFYYVNTGTNSWDVHTIVDGDTASATTSALAFDNNGALTTPAAPATVALNPFTPSTGAGVLSMSLDLTGTTQYGEKFAVNDLRQDGYASGKLNEFTVDGDGIVYAKYSNGQDKALGQVSLTNFTNVQGLSAVGNNLWAETGASGQPRTGAPGTSDFGSIQSEALESSTVDLTEQLVNMITAQRNFQANSQMLSTEDQVTQTVINIR